MDNLTKIDNIYYSIEDFNVNKRSFVLKYCHRIIRLSLEVIPMCLVNLLPLMTNLTSLHLDGSFSRVSNVRVSNISMLTNIRTLDLGQNDVITNDIFTCLPNITSLCLKFNRCITNDCVSKLTNITHLHLEWNNTIMDSALYCLTNITMLNLNHNKLVTHLGISVLTNIKGLDLLKNDMIEDESIELLTNITYLNLKGNNKITNRSLAKLVNLTSIDLNNDKARYTSLDTLPNLVSFKSDDGYLKFI